MAKGSSKKQKQVLALKKLHKEHLATLRKALIDGAGKDRDVTKDPDVQPMMCRLPALAQPQHNWRDCARPPTPVPETSRGT
jgi:hypothetical protein